MIVEYTNTMEDIKAFNSYHFKNSPTMRRQKISSQLASALVFAIAFAGMSIVLTSGSKSTLTDMITVGVVIGLAGAVVIFFASGASIERKLIRNVEKLYGEGKNTSLYEQRSVTINADGVRYTSPSSEGSIKWSTIEKVAATGAHLFLYTSATTALTIPKRALTDDAQWNEFVRLVQSYQQTAANTSSNA